MVDESFETTPLMWALHGWGEERREGAFADVIAQLVAAGSVVDPEWLDDERVRADPKILAALSGRPSGES